MFIDFVHSKFGVSILVAPLKSIRVLAIFMASLKHYSVAMTLLVNYTRLSILNFAIESPLYTYLLYYEVVITIIIVIILSRINICM